MLEILLATALQETLEGFLSIAYFINCEKRYLAPYLDKQITKTGRL